MTKENLATALALHLVEIDGTGIEQGRTYTEKSTGLQKPLPGRQTAYVWQGAKYPLEISVDIPAGKAPYAPGTYLMSGRIYEAGEYGRLQWRGPRDLYLIDLSTAVEALAAIVKEESGQVIDLPAKASKAA